MIALSKILLLLLITAHSPCSASMIKIECSDGVTLSYPTSLVTQCAVFEDLLDDMNANEIFIPSHDSETVSFFFETVEDKTLGKEYRSAKRAYCKSLLGDVPTSTKDPHRVLQDLRQHALPEVDQLKKIHTFAEEYDAPIRYTNSLKKLLGYDTVSTKPSLIKPPLNCYIGTTRIAGHIKKTFNADLKKKTRTRSIISTSFCTHYL